MCIFYLLQKCIKLSLSLEKHHRNIKEKRPKLEFNLKRLIDRLVIKFCKTMCKKFKINRQFFSSSTEEN